MKRYLVGLNLGRKFYTNFDGATLDQINELTDEAGIPRFGHTHLYDGGTGSVSIKRNSRCYLHVETWTHG
jgi:DNA-directed RNA polymerase beta subunit